MLLRVRSRIIYNSQINQSRNDVLYRRTISAIVWSHSQYIYFIIKCYCVSLYLQNKTEKKFDSNRTLDKHWLYHKIDEYFTFGNLNIRKSYLIFCVIHMDYKMCSNQIIVSFITLRNNSILNKNAISIIVRSLGNEFSFGQNILSADSSFQCCQTFNCIELIFFNVSLS